MSDEDNQGQVAGTRFAGDLRRQFEALGERAREPRKRRRVVVGAVVVGAAVAIMLGGVALAGGFHSDEPQMGPTEAPVAIPGQVPVPLAPATSVYPTNANGQTYGPNLRGKRMVEDPDLIMAMATNGKVGYCLSTDLEGPVPRTPEEAASIQAAQAGKDRVIPVYESDGTTQIGVFIIGYGGNASPAPSN